MSLKLSIIQPTRNNLKYLKWSYESLRKNLSHQEHEICVADDFSNDGTLEWCEQTSKKDQFFKYIRNNGPTRLGHTILYDKLINELATNDVVMIYHADMYACPNFDKYIEKYIEPKTVVSLTRIEPPLHPQGPEKILQNFGQEPDEFNTYEQQFLKWFADSATYRNNTTTEGIFAPWAIYKSDFQSINGHDVLYAPQSKEDSDIFNRFLLNDYKFIQTWEGCVYHLTCRGSRYNPTITTVGNESNEWLIQNNKSSRNFVRKWGHFVKHTPSMKPIVPHRYDIGFVIHNCTQQILQMLEPSCDTLYSDLDYSNYLYTEQPNTKFDLSKKLKSISDIKSNDIIIEFDALKLTNNSFQLFNILPDMLQDSGKIGTMHYDIFKFTINQLTDYKNNLIHIDNEWYQNKLL
jgi:glycosyltransferase involved in cell wall biosynthesis